MLKLIFFLSSIAVIIILAANIFTWFKSIKVYTKKIYNNIKESFNAQKKENVSLNSNQRLSKKEWFLSTFSWSNKAIKYIFMLSICIMVFCLLVDKLKIYSFILIFLTYLLIFLAFKSISMTNDRWANDTLVLAIIIIETMIIGLMLAISIFLEDLEKEQFRFSFLIVMMIILISSLAISIYQVYTMKHYKIISFAIISVFASVVTLMFYSYVGYGLIVFDKTTQGNLNKVKLSVEGFGVNGWQDLLSIIYFGLSKVNNWQEIKIVNAKSKAFTINIQTIYIYFIAYVFNLIYFSTIVSALANLIKRKK